MTEFDCICTHEMRYLGNYSYMQVRSNSMAKCPVHDQKWKVASVSVDGVLSEITALTLVNAKKVSDSLESHQAVRTVWIIEDGQ